MEEVTTELSVYLGMLYHMVEVFKGHDDFADELSKCARPRGPNEQALILPISEPRAASARVPVQRGGRSQGQEREGVPGQEGQ